jgi:copper chaperone CopZ
MTQTFSVQGMTCGGCVRHVHDALVGVAGVRSATVDLEHAQATIESEASIPRDRIVSALDEAGYSLA